MLHQEILGQIITDDMTTYDKTLAIYNWIIDNNYYSWHASTYRGNYKSIYDTWCVSQSYSSLCLGYGSCVNYASAFVVLTRAIGLESYKIYGALHNANVNRDHGWAVVNINGKLYTFDPQLSDEAVGNGWGNAMDYFCKDDEHPNVKNYYITYDLDGGESNNLETVFNDVQSIYLSTPTKEGYSFIGWFDENGNEVTELELKDYTLKAKWFKGKIEGNVMYFGNFPQGMLRDSAIKTVLSNKDTNELGYIEYKDVVYRKYGDNFYIAEPKHMIISICIYLPGLAISLRRIMITVR